MRALQFDTTNREIVISNGRTQTTNNPSAQNGIIIRDARCINVFSPVLGIGFNPINSQSGTVNYDLNRWKKQCLQDGAKDCDFVVTGSGIPNESISIDYNIIY